MIFKSRKGKLFTTVGMIVLLLMVLILYSIIQKETLQDEDYISFSIVLIVSVLLIWFSISTQYKISSNHFKYQSGFIKGTIEIKNIHTIIKGKTLWVGLKPATAENGLIIKYNKYDEIYISPKTNDSFIAEILKYNSQIIITSQR